MTEATTDQATPKVRDYKKIASQEPSEQHLLCAEWLKNVTGYDVDPKTVQLVRLLNSDFQKSEQNQAFRDDRAKRSAEAAAQRKAEAEAAKSAKPKRAKKTAAEQETESVAAEASGEDLGADEDMEFADQ